MRHKTIRNALWSIAFLANQAFAQFEGNLELSPQGCEMAGQCILKNALKFMDSAKVVWEAKAGLPTDGASIPGVFQSFVGKPFDPAFIKAAVIHDHYCDRHVRPWRQTHRVFYDALIAQGLPEAKAKAMYFAVYLGGPKWVKLIPGIPCGPGCINNFKTLSGESGIYTRKADYSAPDLVLALDSVAKSLEENSNAISLAALEQRAISVRPNDFFFTNGESVEAKKVGTFK